uniref:Serine/threonine-protein phosphatase n=1 Tax=Homo sapiens TaxID=9606 RepID=B7Z1I1_HUMAN|nr:unnamed protein product [Homo sapiens]
MLRHCTGHRSLRLPPAPPAPAPPGLPCPFSSLPASPSPSAQQRLMGSPGFRGQVGQQPLQPVPLSLPCLPDSGTGQRGPLQAEHARGNHTQREKITVCGDTHGQFYDLLNIFELNGLPSETNPYIFNGDFVDRGSFSVEVILTLFGFKLLYPDHFHLLRGNHETDNMNQIYGFEGEVKAKYTAQMYELFSEVFEWLPLAQCINGKVLIMHGGLFSEDGVTLDDIRKIERNRQPPDSGEQRGARCLQQKGAAWAELSPATQPCLGGWALCPWQETAGLSLSFLTCDLGQCTSFMGL